jgi:hypothetical protein
LPALISICSVAALAASFGRRRRRLGIAGRRACAGDIDSRTRVRDNAAPSRRFRQARAKRSQPLWGINDFMAHSSKFREKNRARRAFDVLFLVGERGSRVPVPVVRKRSITNWPSRASQFRHGDKHIEQMETSRRIRAKTPVLQIFNKTKCVNLVSNVADVAAKAG